LSIHRSMQVCREEYLDYMTFRGNERALFTEIFGPLIGLKQEWQQQGASPAELDLSAFRYRQHMLGNVPVQTGWVGGREPRILEETEDHILGIDRYGRRVQLMKKVATLPLPLDHPVANMDDWLRIRHHYCFDESRFAAGWQQVARQHRDAGRVVTVRIPGGFDEPRQLMGEEALCMAYHDQPELIHEMLSTIADTAVQVLDRVSAEIQVDQLSVHEDMAGKSGPLAGPAQIDAFIRPYYRKVWDMLQWRGARLFDIDSDGDMNPVLDNFLEAGINVMHPMECSAGMDIVKVREKYGRRLAFAGGIDKHVLRRSLEEIDAELEYKVPPMVRTGGCVLGLDHRIPNGTPLSHYRHYIDRMWQIIEREQSARSRP
jgi:hypothetical protein